MAIFLTSSKISAIFQFSLWLKFYSENSKFWNYPQVVVTADIVVLSMSYV